ncbi:MAG: hypothetical protein WKF58_07090 [Ilumatobacteraceae bacterium]
MGPLVSPHLWEDDLVRVSHIPPVDEPEAFVGHLVIETQRHVGYLDELSDDEAAAVGRAARTAARAIRAELSAESVLLGGDRTRRPPLPPARLAEAPGHARSLRVAPSGRVARRATSHRRRARGDLRSPPPALRMNLPTATTSRVLKG